MRDADRFVAERSAERGQAIGASEAGYSAVLELMYLPCSLTPAMSLCDPGGCWHVPPSFAMLL